MAKETSGVRYRGPAANQPNSPASPKPPKVEAEDLSKTSKLIQDAKLNQQPGFLADWNYKLSLLVVTALSFATRFWGISHPNEVVFDEVHFGKFASLYLKRMYFFDVHPPFAKLLFAGVGWLIGYNGDFMFENIGESYIENKVPYLAYRTLPAVLGSLTVSILFLIMWESGYSVPACLAASAFMLFDNAHVSQTRLILLDATLIFFMATSVLAYIRFSKQRKQPFGRKWWKWLLLCGISLSCVMSTKYVGAFTFFSIGVPVVIDLWDLLDVKRKGGKLTLFEFGQHFAARAFGFIVVPFLFYLMWFQVHFAVLSRSGPGDDFMSPQFQETLSDNQMSMQSMGIHYGDVITMRHKDTKVYLHSHPARYPLRYDDGRISSQGQQVTGYPHNDTNNHWLILPSTDDKPDGEKVQNGDVLRFKHVATDTILLTHDVASPYFPTNQEFTTVPLEEANANRYNDTLFELKIERAKANTKFTTKSSHFKLVHVPTRVAMWTHTKRLPEWGFNQAEINGNKNSAQSSNIWFAEDVVSLDPADERLNKTVKKPKTLSFFTKYLELQRLMFHHNNALTSSHPYSSFPFEWPFLLRGVSFWTQNETREQIYFLGNPIGWWTASALLAFYAGVVLADQLSLRRDSDTLTRQLRSQLYYSTGFFFLTWAAHYFPFYLMGRQLFLHHYLPAHLASCLVAGAMVELIPTLAQASPPSDEDAATSPRDRVPNQSFRAVWVAFFIILVPLVFGFYYYAPMTYGTPALTPEQVIARKWLNYDFHFAK